MPPVVGLHPNCLWSQHHLLFSSDQTSFVRQSCFGVFFFFHFFDFLIFFLIISWHSCAFLSLSRHLIVSFTSDSDNPNFTAATACAFLIRFFPLVSLYVSNNTCVQSSSPSSGSQFSTISNASVAAASLKIVSNSSSLTSPFKVFFL